MFDMKTCPSWSNLQELSRLSKTRKPVQLEVLGEAWKRLKTKPWQAKPLSTFRLEIPANHSIGSEPHLWEARTENRKEDGILGPTGFDLKIKVMQACRRLTWTTVINPCQTINAKTNSSRNFQLAAWNTVKEEQGRWFAVRRFWKRKDSKNSMNGNCSSFHDWVAKLFRGASSTGTFNIYKRDG